MNLPDPAELADDARDEITDAAGDIAEEVAEGLLARLKEIARAHPITLPLIGLLLVALFCLGSWAFGSGPLNFFERLFLPVRFITSSTGSGGDWHDVYFTTPPQTYDPADFRNEVGEELIRRIEAAESSILVAGFELNVTPIAEALIAAHERGVDVRWLADDEHGTEADGDADGGQFALMEAAGIPVRDDQRSALMHNKFIIFDEQTVWTGSTNFTTNGLFKNNNNVIVFESEEVAGMYGREFQELWRGNSGGDSRSTFFRQRTNLGDTPVQVFFAPEDNAMDRLVPLVASAEDEVLFMAFAFTHDGLGEELVRQARRGVDVRGVFETRNTGDPASEITRLMCNGVNVRADGNSGTMHHKVFIIDGKIVVTGSYNFSNSADNSNDENMVFLNNSTVAEQYRPEFERVWAEAWPMDPGQVDCR